MSGPDYFRLEQLQEEFNFATDEEINNDMRLQLLELRDREIHEFRNMKMIAPNSLEIHPDVFKVCLISIQFSRTGCMFFSLWTLHSKKRC